MAANMVVRTNVFSLNAHRNMKNVGLQARQASNRLASGYRINSAADDAAGLAISENMRAQIRGLDQASRNAQDGQAMVLTTEGGLDQIGEMLIRIRELTVQAANDTNTQEQRAMIRAEVAQLAEEIEQMQTRIQFNEQEVLNMGAYNIILPDPSWIAEELPLLGVLIADADSVLSRARAAYAILAGIDNQNQALTVGGTIAALHTAGGGTGVPAVGDIHELFDLSGADAADFSAFDVTGVVSDIEIAAAFLGADTVAATRATIDAHITALETRVADLEAIRDGALDTLLGMGDVNAQRPASTSERYVAWFQIGANAGQSLEFDFETVTFSVSFAALAARIVEAGVAVPEFGSGIGRGGDVSQFIDVVDNAITEVNTIRANLGAIQNRLDFTMRSLDISSENLSDAESRVRNADIAREMMAFTMTNVLQQAAVSMLAQANQIPQNLLQLLR